MRLLATAHFLLFVFCLSILCNIVSAQENEGDSISGTLLMLDDRTPHVACVVQVVIPAPEKPEVVETTLTDSAGRYEFKNLLPRTYQVRCYTLKGYVYYESETTVLQVSPGTSLRQIDFRIAPFKKGTWKNYTSHDGLKGDSGIWDLHQTRDGAIWIATVNSGVSRFDGNAFHTLTKEDGLLDDKVMSIYEADDGTLWFGTWKGVSHYDGEKFINLTAENGLTVGKIWGICQARDGAMWFAGYEREGGAIRYEQGTVRVFTEVDGLPRATISRIYLHSSGELWFGISGRGVARYDGQTFTYVPPEDMGIGGNVNSFYETEDGRLWFGSWAGKQGGVSIYDGEAFTALTPEDGLVEGSVWTIAQAPDGAMWFGTNGGASRYDGENFVNYTKADGLVSNQVTDIHVDADGLIWFGTIGGLSQYDTRSFTNFQAHDGLPVKGVWSILQDAEGRLWLSTYGRGVFSYDGRGFGNLTTQDGLIHDNVYGSYQDATGNIWFATEGGVSRYDGLAADQIYDVFSASNGAVWIAGWGGISRYNPLAGQKGEALFTSFTISDGLVNSNITGIDEDVDGTIWFASSAGLGGYDGYAWTLFDERDGLADEGGRSVCIDTNGSIWLGTYNGVIARYRKNASRPQMEYITVETGRVYTDLSRVPPTIVGTRVTFAYNSIDYKTVGAKRQYRISLREDATDRVIHDSPTKRTQTKTLHLANAGHHAHPLLIRNGTIEPLLAKGMPLGMIASIPYRAFDFDLQSGDVLVFMTDGMIEAKDTSGTEYQETDRQKQVIDKFTAATSAETMVSALINDVTTFGAQMTAEEEDDITVVVVKVL